MLIHDAPHDLIGFGAQFLPVQTQKIELFVVPEYKLTSEELEGVRMSQEVISMPDFFDSVQTYLLF